MCPSSSVLTSLAPLCSLPAFGRGSFAFPVLLESAGLLEEGSFHQHKHVLPLRSPDSCRIGGCSHLFFISMHLRHRGWVRGQFAASWPPHGDLDQTLCTSASRMEGLMPGDGSGAPRKSSSVRNHRHRVKGIAFLQCGDNEGGS